MIVKFFLHISKDAQLDRFRERLEREDKHYKFSANDVRERRNWDAYQEAYEDAVNADLDAVGAVVRRAVRPQVVPEPRRGADRRRDAGVHGPVLAGARRGSGGLRAGGARGERLLQAVGERLARQHLADVEDQRGRACRRRASARAWRVAGSRPLSSWRACVRSQ